MSRLVRILRVLPFLVAAGCSSGEDGDHVWKGQVDTIDKAKAVEKTVQDGFEQRREIMERQSQ